MKRHPKAVRLLIATVISLAACETDAPVYQPEGHPCAGGERTNYIGGSWMTSYQAALDNNYSYRIFSGVFVRPPGQVIIFDEPDTSVKDGEWYSAHESNGSISIGEMYRDFGKKPIEDREFCVSDHVVFKRQLGPLSRR